MESSLIDLYFTELATGGMLSAFAAFLRYWFVGVTRSIDRIADKMELLLKEFSDHKVDDAKAFGRLNADVNNIYKTMDRRSTRELN